MDALMGLALFGAGMTAGGGLIVSYYKSLKGVQDSERKIAARNMDEARRYNEAMRLELDNKTDCLNRLELKRQLEASWCRRVRSRDARGYARRNGRRCGDIYPPAQSAGQSGIQRVSKEETQMEAREIMARRAPSLEERINALRDKGVVIGGTTYRYNFAQISAATGVSRSMISMFANGNIRIKPEQQKILEDWVSDIERQAQEEAIETGAVEETPAPAPQTFKRNIELYQTHEFTEALGLLEWTRDNRKMCVMVGYPGIGKTTVIREFAKRVPDVHVIVCRSTMRMRDLLDSIAESIGVSASGSNDERVRRHSARTGGEP